MKKLSQKQFKAIVKNMPATLKPEFYSKQASAFGIMLGDQNQIQFEKIGSSLDIYDMLDGGNTELIEQVKNYDLITIQTNGWAAPIDYDEDENNQTPPSLHSKKRRVALLITANTNSQIGNAIIFQDDPYNPQFDWGNAEGNLNEAVLEFLNMASN